MSLILAIEPNKNQAHQLNALVRQYLKAELVTAPTAAAALAALGDRIPDVVLTPALFGLRDEAALTERLRQLGSDGSHVQTLAIPILASTSRGGNHNGLLGRKKDKGGDANVGCDPAVFAEQIKIYLQRASVERRAQASEVTARAMSAAPRSAATANALAQDDDLSSFMVGADEFDVDSLEIPSFDPPAATPPAQQPQPVSAPPAESPADAQNRRGKPKQNSRQPNPVEEELGLVTPPAAGPPLWRVTQSIEDFYGTPEDLPLADSRAESFNDSRTVAATGAHTGGSGAATVLATDVGDAATVASPLSPESYATVIAPVDVRSIPVAEDPSPASVQAGTRSPDPQTTPSTSRVSPRRPRTPPSPDDWGYFDPSQSGFRALIRRLDEIAGQAA